MPELPEVETIRRGLEKFVVGHTIRNVEIRLAKQFRGDPNAVIGAKVKGVRRFGKGLVIDLANGFSIAVHVKMTGQLLYVSNLVARPPARGPVELLSRPTSSHSLRALDGSPSPLATPRLQFDLPDKYTHVVFRLDNNAVLYYRDMRQFGWVHVLPTQEVSEMAFFKSLGPEPLKDLTLDLFSGILKKTRMPIKMLLMDQRKIAGIGNIYANDALYRAKIHPKRPSLSLKPQEIRALFEAIESVLQKGIEVGGASEWHYVDVLGGKGQYQNFFLVYHQQGKKCPKCNTIIERMVLGGRGTFFCPTCQKL